MVAPISGDLSKPSGRFVGLLLVMADPVGPRCRRQVNQAVAWHETFQAHVLVLPSENEVEAGLATHRSFG